MYHLHYNHIYKGGKEITDVMAELCDHVYRMEDFAMIKLNILNMKNFLETVNNLCKGEVTMHCPDGKRQNISRQYAIQDELLKEYTANRNCLQLILDITNPHDYISIVSYYAGDC